MRRYLSASARPIIALALFYFTFLGIEYHFDSMMALIVPAESVVFAQSLILGISAVGFLVYPLFDTRLSGKVRMATIGIGTALILLCLVEVTLHPSVHMTQAAGCLAFLILGIFGGAAHHTAAVRFADNPYLARFVSFAYAGGLLLQFASNNLTGSIILQAVLYMVAIVAMVFLLVRARPGKAESAEQPDKADRAKQPEKADCAEQPDHSEEVVRSGKTDHVTSRTDAGELSHLRVMNVAGCLIGAVAALTCLFVNLDNVVTLANARNIVDVASWPRMLLAGSALLAGALFDISNRRFMTLGMFCVALLSLICIFLMENDANVLIGLSVFYISSGFLVVFFTSVFFSLALRMRTPQLWAGMGRVINNLMAIVIGGPSLLFVSLSDSLPIEVISPILLAIAAIFLFNSSGISKMQTASPEPGPASASSPQHRVDETFRLADFCATHGLTRREQEVLDRLIAGETDNEIAEGLFISTNTVRFHVGNILKKTGSASRVDAVRKAQTHQVQS